MALPIGYYEAPLHGEAGTTFMGVWLPLKKASPQPLGAYASTIRMDKKLAMMVAMAARDGLPRWIPSASQR